MDNQPSENNRASYFESFRELLRRRKDGTIREIIDDWKWIFGYSSRYKGAIAFYVILGIISTTLGLAGSIAGKYLIDIITGYKLEKLALLICITVGSMLLSLLFDSVISRISAKISIDINNDIQADIFDKIVDADWLSINAYSNGDILNRFNSDIGTVASNAINWLPTILIAVYRFAATFLVILHYDAVMALIALASAPILIISSGFLMKRQRMHGKRVRQMSSSLMTFEAETFYNFDTIKSFGISGFYSRKMREWQKKYRDVTLDYNLFSIKTNVFISILSILVEIAAFGYCLFLLWTHAITFGTMTLFLQQGGNLTSAFKSLVGIVPNFLNSSVSAHRIRELVELPRETHIPESSDMDEFADEGFTVSMRGVDFSYTEGEKVLRSSELVAAPGEIVALVGASGEGKTTLIRLILGLVRPESGAVTLRAANGREVGMNAETRHFFAYVPQGNTIIAGTIAENLRMVRENASDDELIEALRLACAWEFVEKLPGNINANIGERGKGLSEGQAQRIAIAGAILRDAPVLLLDEATSALDVAPERRVLRNIVTALYCHHAPPERTKHVPARVPCNGYPCYRAERGRVGTNGNGFLTKHE